MLAMRTVHWELLESAEYLSGELSFANQSDLDLPSSWGSGPLYHAGPPPS